MPSLVEASLLALEETSQVDRGNNKLDLVKENEEVQIVKRAHRKVCVDPGGRRQAEITSGPPTIVKAPGGVSFAHGAGLTLQKFRMALVLPKRRLEL